MNTAPQILSHAIKMVFGNFGATLRATAPGLLMGAGAAAALVFFAPAVSDIVLLGQEPPAGQFAHDNIAIAVFAFFAMWTGHLITVTSWHRYVLRPDARHIPGFGVLLGYLGRSILIGLIILMMGIPLALSNYFVFDATQNVWVFELMIIGIFAVVGWAALRISLILPASSISERMTLVESWTITKDLSFSLFQIALVLAIADFLVRTAQIGVFGNTGPLAGAVGGVVSMVFTLMTASVLTTLYGLKVERRAI